MKAKKSKKDKKKSKKKKKDQNNLEEDDEPIIEMVVNRDIGEMPDGAEDSDGVADLQKDINDPHTALDIDLDVPEIELLQPPSLSNEEKKHKKKKKEKKERKDKEKKKRNEKSKKSKKLEKNDEQLIEIKQGYEEALGICTPSKEIVQAEDLSFNKLAMDKFVLLVSIKNKNRNNLLLILNETVVWFHKFFF